jgi:1-acyl-sn-glycerol-3-phosphate acyltransferase
MIVQFVRGVRSLLAVLGVIFLFAVPGTLVMYLYVLPVSLSRRRRFAVGSWFLKWMAHWILRILGWGGARFERSGILPTAEPSYVVMNHQSQLDICTAAEMGEPYAPIFVPRARYARFIPLISKTIRMVGCPIVDPQRDVRGALRAMKKAAVELRGALLVFPEGHRSRDGEVLPFRARGMVSLLQTRRLPVYVIANDGLWRARRFVDVLFHGAALHGETELLGPFTPPEDDAALEAFVATLREKLVASVLAMRARRRAA